MIREIHLANFKCFQQERIPLNRLTVLSGGNGVGKSSVIQSLLLLRQTGDRARLLAAAVKSAGVSGPLLNIKLNDEYRLNLGNSATLTNADLESDIVVLGVSDGDAAPIMCRFEASNTKPTTSISCIEAPKDLLARVGALSIFHPEFHYLIAERVGPRDLQPMADQPVISTGFAGEFTAFAIAQADAEGRKVAEPLRLEASSNLFRVQLEAWMGRLVPGAQIFARPYPDLNRVQMAIGRRGATVQALPPANTGFGISYALPVVVSGLLASPGSMLIVENPEAHLHPGAQTAIGIFLATVAAAGVQVLVETHSENVLNGVRLAALRNIIPHSDASFLFLSIGEGAGQPILHPITMNKAAELTSWPPGFFDQQGADLAEMMTVRRALTEHSKT
jgi:predicted ATPase